MYITKNSYSMVMEDSSNNVLKVKTKILSDQDLSRHFIKENTQMAQIPNVCKELLNVISD